MSLTREEARNFIEDIFKNRAVEGYNTRSLAYSLQKIITDSLSGDKYIGELLQNADDAGSIKVSFIRVEEYLIFKHSGKHFDLDDVTAICDSANPDRLKLKQAAQIGNKGIGFKAVFSLADEISILSHHVHFRFDEHYEHWRDCSKEYPWQIIPIYTDISYFPESVQNHCDKDSVHFVFKLRPEIIETIQQQLDTLRTRHLLFLRHIKKCTIVSAEGKKHTLSLKESIKQEREENDDFIIENIRVNANSSWWLYHRNCLLPKALRTKIAKADNIPEKYKSFSSIPISIAILEEKKMLSPLKEGQTVFCYLATDLDFNIHFAFNSEFLLDISRMQLRKDEIANAWNGFILQCMVAEQVKFLSMLSFRTSVWRNVFEILSADYQVPEIFAANCKESFDLAIQKQGLVTNFSNETVLTCKKTTVDLYGFIQAFGRKEDKENTAHPEMKNKDLIIKLGARKFQSIDIANCFNEEWLLQTIDTPEKNKEFISMMKEVYNKSIEKDKFAQKFKAAPLILDSANTLRTVAEVYFPDDTLKYAIKKSNFIVMVHPVIASLNRQWLSEMGVKTLTLKEIIAMANKAESSLVVFLISLANSTRVFSEKDWEHLKALKIITASGEALPASGVYLSNNFSPETKLQKFFGANTNLFCHPAYSDEKDEKSLERIAKFLIKVGVHSALTESLFPKLVATANAHCSAEKLIQLTYFLYEHYFAEKECSESILKAFKNLKVVCADGAIRPGRQTYLADFYEPEEKLEETVPDLPFISVNYYKEETNLDDLVEFFMVLGVNQSISIESHYNPNRIKLIEKQPAAAAYFTYLEKTYKTLYPFATGYYMNQHELDGYYIEISFINRIMKQPFFWKMLAEKWPQIAHLIQATHYKTRRSETPIISNIQYYVILAMQHAYGPDAHPQHYFGQTFADELAPFFEGFSVAKVTAFLSIEQCAILGFKNTMTVAEVKMVLGRIADQNKGARDFIKIVFLYQKLILALKEERIRSEKSEGEEEYEEESGKEESGKEESNEEELDEISESNLPQDCLLLARDNQFRTSAELCHIEGSYLTESKSGRLIKPPNTISEEDFCELCDFFKIRRIQVSELKINTAAVIESTLADHIYVRLGYCIYAIALLDDLSGEVLQIKRAEMKVVADSLFEKLRFVCSDSINICFGGFLTEPQDCWIDRPSAKIYHLPYDNLDHQNRQQLFNFCCEFLSFAEHKEIFLSIMTSSMDKLEQKYEGVNECQRYDVEKGVIQLSLNDSKKSKAIQKEPERKRKIRTDSLSNNSDGESEQAESSPMDLDSVATSPSSSSSFFAVSPPRNKKSRLESICAVSGNTQSAVDRIEPMQKKEKLKAGFFSERFTQEQRKELGREGEQKVYDFLKKKHIEKYGKSNITENKDGYIIKRPNDDIKMVSWLNKEREQYKPYDFEIRVEKASGETKLRHLEVKTTTQSSSQIEVMYSAGEWQQLEQDTKSESGSSRLFVVKAFIDASGTVIFEDPVKINVLEDDRVRATDMKKLTIQL